MTSNAGPRRTGGFLGGGRGGAMLIKSVSLFLASGRRASSNAAAHRSEEEKNRRKTRKMGDENTKSGMNKVSVKMMEHLKRTTHFTRQEIEALHRVYRKLICNNPDAPSTQSNVGASSTGATTTSSGITTAPAYTNEGLDRIVFRELIHNTFDLVTEEVLIDRIFCAFDRFNDGVIGLEEWVTGLSVFLRGTLDEKTAFCYHVYDLNNDGFITRDEMLHLLRNCLVKHPQDEDPDEGVKDLVELALRKLDYDKDGKISYLDFQMTVRDEPLLLEAFGQCLPADNACQTFMSTL